MSSLGTPILAYANPQALTYAVEEVMCKNGISPTMPLPWNRFKPVQSLWWINPSNENPAYRHGKYIFDPNLSPEHDIFVGMHFEKGFGDVTASIMSSGKERRCLMEESWIWHRFIQDLATGVLNQALTKMADSLETKIRLRIDASHYQGGEFDPYMHANPVDTVEFVTNGAHLSCDEATSCTMHGMLPEVSECVDLSALAKALRLMPNEQWVWISFYIGADFDWDREGKTTECWDAHKLWNCFLHPLRPWYE